MSPDLSESLLSPLPPDREFFAVRLIGLPLGLKDNLICSLVIVLAVALQVRFQNTLAGEGWFALLGFVGYVALRLWLLNRRYADPGELLIDEGCIVFPASLNWGTSEKVSLAEFDKIRVNIFIGRGGSKLPASIEFFSGLRYYKISWLAIDLPELERALQKRNLPVTREVMYLAPVLLFIFIIVVLLLFAIIGRGWQ
ncbi:MAG: hypothetical protein EOM80_07445 [Erysipelotrichia bacterium]|nr:hypothetical protein [Erysipelotrichia bacterium]